MADAIPKFARSYTESAVGQIVDGLGKKQYDLFSRNVILNDLYRDVERGLYQNKELPFGYKSAEHLKVDKDKFDRIVASNPKILEAIRRRNVLMDGLRERLVGNELISEEAGRNSDYFHHQVLAYLGAKKHMGMGLSQRSMKMTKKGFQKKRTGSELDYNTEYVEAESEVIAQAITQIEKKILLDRLKTLTNRRDFFVKQAKQLGEENWKKLIPDDYTIWKPKDTLNLFKSEMVPEKIMEQFLSGERELFPEDLKTMLTVGRQEEWVVPKNIAETFNQLKPITPVDDGPVARVATHLLNKWKQWVLINPYRLAKYNINNASGDADITMAYNPKIFKYATKSGRELKQYWKSRKMTPEIEEALRLGVIESGLTPIEIPDIGKADVFRSVTGEKVNPFVKWWKTSKEFTQWRENILRLAAYKHFKNELGAGKNVYGASRKTEVDAIKNVNEKAAKLARELIGDYGNISQAGQWIRQKLIPFWSFQEINLPRYVRLFKNLSAEGRGTGKPLTYSALRGAGKLTWKGTKLVVLASLMRTMVELWNNSMYPEEQKKLSDEYKKQGHLIIGKRDDGSIRTIRLQGALTEALEWFGLDDMPQKIKDLSSGEKNLKEIAEESLKAPFKKALTSSRPEPKLLFELVTGRSLYPDPEKTRPIRDRGEYIARVLSLSPVYKSKIVAGMPERKGEGIIGSLSPTYLTDTGESAYWKTRQMEIDFLKKSGYTYPQINPTEKSNALYFYKQALKFGDDEAAEKYLKKYVKLGGTAKGMKISVKKGKPLGLIPRVLEQRFIDSLTKEERDTFLEALEWYKSIYK